MSDIKKTETVEVVTADQGPVFSPEELAAIDTIASGGAVEGIDVHKLDAAIISGIAAGAGAAEKGLRDMAGFMGAALKLRTWTRVIDPGTGTLFASEAAFVEWTLSKTPLLATVARRELLAVIDGITDENGKPLSVRRMGELLGIGKSVVQADRAALAAEGDAEGAERGPQTGGQVEPDAKAVKRYVTALQSNATKVRDAEASMTAEQLLAVIAEGKDLVSTAVASLRLRFPDTELPDWTAVLARPTGPGRLRSGAEGTVASGPVLAGAPVDPTATVAPAKPKPGKPRAAAAS